MSQIRGSLQGILLFPGIERGVADAELSTKIADRGAALGLAEGVDDLLFGELRPLQGPLLSSETAEAASLL
jgi:hypothetical protein